MTVYDEVIPRRATHSTKWSKYPEDVLPFWVADMDFAAPDFVLDAIKQRLAHPIIGYTDTPRGLIEAFQGWLFDHYGWSVDADWLVWIPGVVPGINLAAQALATGGTQVVPTPVYYPFLDVAAHSGAQRIDSPLIREGGRWAMDFERLAEQLPTADVLLLSNPQNPTGRAYTVDELNTLSELCIANDVVVIADEIHSAMILEPGCRHVPIATLNQELRSVSLYAPTKTYNIPGLSCAVAVVPDVGIRKQFLAARRGLVSGPGALAYAACEAAFRDRSEWLPGLLEYLRGNRDRLADVVGDRMALVEATYLGWIDVRQDVAEANAERHFLRHGLGLSIGRQFAGPGFVRFNFACPRATLEPGLQRLRDALGD